MTAAARRPRVAARIIIGTSVMKRHGDPEKELNAPQPGRNDQITDINFDFFDNPHALPRALYTVGTRIATVRGEVPVEHLGVGDVVLTPAGERICVRELRRWSGDWRPGRLGGP
ncbi:Hint domain-containing protein, partial [Acidisphaera rubrifaciens]|uniref:Hint domain-containing protein n=1 Tax=Acidisphaera rubrifaciens TaxID=50715 RepID=UPI0019D71660